MDVGKMFGKPPEKALSGPINRQKLPPATEEDDFENEGGWVAPSEEVTEVLKQPIQEWVSMTSPASYLHPLYQLYNSLVHEVVALRDKKGRDYGTDEDPFANVRGAQEFGVAPWIGAANSANDCMTRIKQYAKTGRLENESVRDSMLDLINYGLITLTLWEEENEQ